MWKIEMSLDGSTFHSLYEFTWQRQRFVLPLLFYLGFLCGCVGGAGSGDSSTQSATNPIIIPFEINKEKGICKENRTHHAQNEIDYDFLYQNAESRTQKSHALRTNDNIDADTLLLLALCKRFQSTIYIL